MDIFQFWEKQKKKEIAASSFAAELREALGIEGGVYELIKKINSVLERYNYSRANADNIARIRNELRQCGLDAYAIEYIMEELSNSQQQIVTCNGIGLELRRRPAPIYTLGDAEPRYFRRGFRELVIKPSLSVSPYTAHNDHYPVQEERMIN